MKNKRGQSLVEIIFSVGIISLVIVGVVSLVVNVIGAKNSSLERKKASEMAGEVIEGLLETKIQDPDSFWELNDVEAPQTIIGFDGYSYTIDFTKVEGDGCRTEVNDCADAVINVVWDGGENNLSVNRFFSRRI